MEHPGGVTGLTPGVTAWTAETIAALPPGERQTIAALVNEAGARSARAQALPTAITSTVRAPEKKKAIHTHSSRPMIRRRLRFAPKHVAATALDSQTGPSPAIKNVGFS